METTAVSPRTSRSASQGPVRQWGLAAYWFSLNFQGAALIAIVVPEMISRINKVGRTTELARLAALAAFVTMVVPPLIGIVSDRLRARGTNRRTLLVAGTAVNVCGLVAASQATSVEALAGLIVVALVGQSAATASYQAMLPEVVPREHWGSASGYMAVASLAGTVAGLATAGLGSVETAYWGMVGAAGLGALYTTVTVREPARVVDVQGRVTVRDWHRFRWVFAARFMVILAQTLLMTFVLYFFEEVLHVRRAAGGTALVAGLALVGAGVSAFSMGRVSDRRDRALVVAWAGIPMAAAVTGFALWPNPRAIFALAILWGLGYGAFLSVDWALALDSIPDLANVARDLGVWGIASNLPAVVAPLLGGYILARSVNADVGYRVLFLTAGAAFLAGSLVVLRVRETAPRMSAGAWIFVFLIAGILKVYVTIDYRVRWSGALPKDRQGLLVVANHIHDLEGMAIPSGLFWRDPGGGAVDSAGSRRLFEPGFLATRSPRWLGRWLTPINLGWVLRTVGVHPIENEPLLRPPVSWAYGIYRRHGDLLLADVFTPQFLGDRYPAGVRLSWLWHIGHHPQEERPVSHRVLLSPYREESRKTVRNEVVTDLQELVHALRRGATLYLTPEGHMTETGALGRFRAALDWLLPAARDVAVMGTAYDPWASRRLSLYVSVSRLAPEGGIRDQILLQRPVTAGQLLSQYVLQHSEGGALPDLFHAARGWAASGELPLTDDTRMVLRHLRPVLARMARRGVIRLGGDHWTPGVRVSDPRIPLVPNIVEAQAVQLEETLEAIRRVGSVPGAVPEDHSSAPATS